MAMPSAVHGRWRFPLRKPPAIGPGARLAVVAPASAFDVDAFHAGVAELTALGFEASYDASVFERTWYVAGEPAVRAAALERAWRDPSIDGIIAVRGGYGSVHVLPLLDPDLPRRHPKVFIGYSDITSLHIWLGQQGQVAFQGPMLEGRLALGAERYDRDTFLRAITLSSPLGQLPAPALEALVPGEAAGPIVGGTLTQIAASLGTPFAFDPPDGCVLFIEDVAERPYRLDRLLTQAAVRGHPLPCGGDRPRDVPRVRRSVRRAHGAHDARLSPAGVPRARRVRPARRPCGWTGVHAAARRDRAGHRRGDIARNHRRGGGGLMASWRTDTNR